MMRATLLAAAGVLLALGYFLPAIPIGAPASVEAIRNIGLVFVTCWLAVELLILARGAKGAREAQASVPTTELDAARLKRRITEIEARADDLVRRNNELEAAYTDAHAKLARIEQDLKQKLAKSADAEVLNLLSLLQLKGRFIDFIMDDITKYPDAQVGAAARVVHQGCSQVVRDYFDIKPVSTELEGSPLTLDKDYDARSFRLLGRVTGEAPFRGRLLHRGWLTTTVRLPESVLPEGVQVGRGIIAPAEVELH